MLKLHNFLPAALILAAVAFSCAKPEEQQKQEQETPDTPKTEKPVIKTTGFEIEAKGDTYQLKCSVDNPAEGAAVTAEITPADWIKSSSVEGTVLSVTVTDNLSAPRSTKIKLSYPKADDVEITLTQAQWSFPDFDISVSDLGPFGATFTITRGTGYTGGYYFEVLDRKAFDSYVADDQNKVGEFAYGEKIHESDVAYLNRLAQNHGHSLADLFTMIPGLYSKNAVTEIPYNTLDIDSDYVFIVYGMEATDEAKRRTPIAIYQFRTEYATVGELTFTGEVKNLSETYADVTVTPSNNGEYWYMDYVSEIALANSSLANVMQKAINNAKSLLNKYPAEEILCRGPETVQATDLMPGTKYTVVAWGMDLQMASTTSPKAVMEFTTPEYETIDNCTFQVETLEVEDMDIKVRVTPSNLDTRYYVAFVEKSKMEGYNDNQAAQRIINMEAQRIENHYYDVPNLGWNNLPGLEAGVREIWGRRDEGWAFVPRTDYRIYVFGIDNYGIRTTAVKSLDVTTAEPQPSTNTFQVTIDSNTWQGLDFTVTPSNDDEYWLTFLAEKSDVDKYFRYNDGSIKEKEIFEQWIAEYYEDEITQRACRGTRTLHEHTVPDTDYVLLVFGYAGSYTTKMYEWELHAPVPPLGKSDVDYSYTYELFRGEDLTALDPVVWNEKEYKGDCIMVVRFNLTGNPAHWYFGCWPPVENFADQGGQYYLMTLDMNPDVAGSAMQDKLSFRNRPWWYGSQENYQWVDSEGDIVNHWPWSLSGWAEDADGNYGPWHYELFIPVPVPKEEVPAEGHKYEVGYTKAYNFWSSPAAVPNMQIYTINY